MLNPQLIERFNDCVDRLLAGATVDDCLRLYPDDAPALRPLLESGQVVRRIQPTDAEIAAAQARGQARLDFVLAQPYVRRAPARRWVSTLAGLAAVFVLLFAGAAYAAESTLPGDALYPLKLFTENARGAIGGETVRETFAARRVEEVRALLSLGRSAFVTFTGEVEAMDSPAWQVEGIALIVTDAANVDAEIDVSDVVEVSGVTTPDSTLLASAIRLVDDRQITPPAPTPSPVPTLMFTRTPLPTQTPQPTATITITPSSTATATPSPTVPPTLTPTPLIALHSTLSALCTPTPPQGWVRYTVQQGDTVSGLAAARGITVEVLMAVNCLTDARFVFVGQSLFLPINSSSSSNSGGSGNSGSGNGGSGGSSGSGGSPTSPPSGGGSGGSGGDPPPDDDDDGDEPDDPDD
jgi:LysM repeat protein